MSKYNVLSLFSGAGGMDLGFIQQNFEIVWANDFNKDAVETYRKNIGNHIVLGDITKIKSNEIAPSKRIDVLIGGFPCQGFSIANKNRNEQDERNFLYKEMLRLIKDKNPKIFVAENVKGILSLGKGKVMELIISDFKQLGYNVEYKILNSADYGVPQQRERVIIIGSRINTKIIFPEKTHKDLYPGEENSNILDKKYKEEDKERFLPYKTVKETIKYLENFDIRNSYKEEYIELNGEKIYNHIASTNVAKKFKTRKYHIDQAELCDYLRKYRDNSKWTTSKIDEYFGYKHTAGHWFRKDNKSGSIPKPEDWKNLKKILKFDDKFDKKVLTFIEKDIKFEQSLRITNWNRASDTITATSPEIHINKMRRLSVRETAEIQTFPRTHRFYGSLNSQYRQVGNAVPVKLAYEIAKCIDKMLGE